MSYASSFKNKFIFFFVSLIIGAICLYYVISSFNWNEIWQPLKKINSISFFLNSTLIILTYFFIRTIRWHLLLRSENLTIPFIKLYLYNAVSIGISTITPFQLGETIKVELLRKYGCNRLSGYTVFFLERLLDFSTIISLAIVGVTFGINLEIPNSYFYISVLIFVLVLLTVAGVIFLIPFERLKPIKSLLWNKLHQKLTLLLAVFLTILSWFTVVLGWKMTLSYVSIDIGLIQASSVVSLTTMLVIISFVPGAIGISEISIATILSKMNIELSLAQTGAVAIRAYILMILVLTFLHLIVLFFFKRIFKRSY